MTLSNTSILSAVELALYALLAPLALLVIYRHGRPGFLGYFYLNISIGVRIAAAIAQLADNNKPPSLTATILSSIGISPLILAMSGILHEIHHYILLRTSTATTEKRKSTSRWLIFLQVQFHTLCTVALALLVTGSVHLIEAKSASDVDSANKLREAGAALLFVTWLGLVQYVAWLFLRYRGVQHDLSRRTIALRTWVAVALLFGGAKVVYAVVYSFDHEDGDINPITGLFVIKVVLVVGTQLAAVVAMVVGGWLSLGIVKEHLGVQKRSADASV